MISTNTEAAARGVLLKKVFLKILQISQKKNLWTHSCNFIKGLQLY